jgi:hypothetical protein
MSQDRRPIEHEAVKTTIVGGRPPGSGKPVGPIPRGIEVLIKKAAVDPEFKALLLEKRADAAREIGLVLDPAEAMMLRAAPAAQLEAIIARTSVAPSQRSAFLGRAAAVMLVALGAGTIAGCDQEPPPTKGIAPDRPTATQPAEPVKSANPSMTPTDGIRPDRPLPAQANQPSTAPAMPMAGVAPDVPAPPPSPPTPAPPTGIRPDRPPTAQLPTPAPPAPVEPPTVTGIRPDRPPDAPPVPPPGPPAPTGIRPDRPPTPKPPEPAPPDATTPTPAPPSVTEPSTPPKPGPSEPVTRGIRPDRPPPKPAGEPSP